MVLEARCLKSELDLVETLMYCKASLMKSRIFLEMPIRQLLCAEQTVPESLVGTPSQTKLDAFSDCI